MALGSLGKLFVELGIDTAALEKGIDKAKSDVSGLGAAFQKHGKVMGAAMAGAGVGMMALTGSSMKTNAALGTTALQLGITTEEMRGLAIETSNVTFPLAEVTASFDLLTRAGMTNKDQIAATATAFDTLGDAIGQPASEVTKSLIPAFNAFGIPLEDAGKHTDTFTHLMRNTTVELSDFSGMLNYLAADLTTMDISMTESVAVMEALADKGIQGSAATREFRTAVSGAEGDTDKFYEALGLTAAEVAVYTDKVESADGMTQKFADSQNKQYTTMDKLKHALSEATLQYGSLLEPVEALGPVMTTLGPIMIVASTVNWAHAASAWAVVAPYLAIVIPILAVIAVLYILEKKFGIVTKAVDIAKTAFGFLLELLTNLVGKFREAGGALMTALADGITSGISNAIDAVEGAVAKVRSYLPGSDAKVGPLSDITASGAALMATFEKGIATSSANPAAAFAARAPQVGGGGGGDNVTNSSSVSMGDVNLSNDFDFMALMEQIDRYQATKRTQRGVA